ncbi:MAG: DUF389 domain-containing protein [Bacteroidales bacterium]
MHSFFQKIIHVISLDNQLDDFDTIHDSIVKGINFRGSNLWILVFAILVASVGLNMNSTAVVIGAMLISPLMGPINGVGYSIATYNFPLFRKSVKNFGFAVVASLIASTFYFALSPISTAHSELLARTSPTIYDVLIALFGGLAGIVAMTSKQKGNVIPGVAIATALMPPLCTAGYGLATGQFMYFFGALYLFTINSVFIAISALVVSQILRFPIRTIIDTRKKAQINRWISMVIMFTVVPSIYFGYGLVQTEKFSENASLFAKTVSVYEGNFLLNYEADPNTKEITLVYGGASFTQEQRNELQSKMKNFDLNNATLTIKQGFSFDDMDKENAEIRMLRSEIARQKDIITEKQSVIDSISLWRDVSEQISQEAQALFPNLVHSCTYSHSQMYNREKDRYLDYAIVIFQVYDEHFDEKNKQKIYTWLSSRLQVPRLKIFYEYIPASSE